jgi:hypothetical protein
MTCKNGGKPLHEVALDLIREAVGEIEKRDSGIDSSLKERLEHSFFMGNLDTGLRILEEGILPEKDREEITNTLCEIRDNSSSKEARKEFSEISILGISGKNEIVNFLKSEKDFSSEEGLYLLEEVNFSVISEAVSADNTINELILKVLEYQVLKPYLKRKLLLTIVPK